jgi:hypothetical protein
MNLEMQYLEKAVIFRRILFMLFSKRVTIKDTLTGSLVDSVC